MTPEAPNGVKLEAFIFDSFPLAAKAVILEVERGSDFSPVKNAPGAATDSPDTAREMIMLEHREWVESAGGNFEMEVGGVEISPLQSYAGEGLGALVAGKTLPVGKELP